MGVHFVRFAAWNHVEWHHLIWLSITPLDELNLPAGIVEELVSALQLELGHGRNSDREHHIELFETYGVIWREVAGDL